MQNSVAKKTFDKGYAPQICPISHLPTPNMAKTYQGFHISYTGYMDHYGSDTTALVLKEQVFFILSGSHGKALEQIADDEGIQGCIEYFIKHLDQANKMSDHLMAVGLKADPLKCQPVAIEILGQATFDHLLAAISARTENNGY